MKKVYLLIAFLVLAGYGFAQQTLIYDSFEEYTVGNHISTEANAAGHSWWTTFSGVINHQPADGEDGVVSNEHASDGFKSAYISNLNDNILLIGDLTEGDYELSFDVYVSEGQHGYFNLGRPENSFPYWQFNMQVYINAQYGNGNPFHSPGHGSVILPTWNNYQVMADLPCVEDEWMHFLIRYNAADYDIELYFNDELYYDGWASFNAVDFCPDANIFYSGFYVDNVSLVRHQAAAVSESSSPMVNLYPNPTRSVVTLEGDHLESVSIYNAVGQLVRMEALNDGTNTLELDLKEGVYFFRVDDNNGNHTVQKVAVVR